MIYYKRKYKCGYKVYEGRGTYDVSRVYPTRGEHGLLIDSESGDGSLRIYRDTYNSERSLSYYTMDYENNINEEILKIREWTF